MELEYIIKPKIESLMVGINSNYSSNTYLNGMANVGKNAVVDAMNGKDSASIFTGMLEGSIDSLTNSISESCSTDAGKNLVMVLGAAIKMLLAYVIGSAENEARNNTSNAQNIANTGQGINQGILDGTNEVIADSNEQIQQYRTSAENSMNEILENNESAQSKIDSYESEQDGLSQTLSETQGKRSALGNEKTTLTEKIANLQNELNADKGDKSVEEQKKEAIQAKKEEIKEEKAKMKEAKHNLKDCKKAYKKGEITQSEYIEKSNQYSGEIELHGINIDRLDGELKELMSSDTPEDLNTAKQQELANLTKQLSQVDARITECDNTINETLATMNGNHDALVGYIESANAFDEEKSGEFESALNNILQTTSTTQEKIGQVQEQLEKFNVQIEGVENQQLAEQLVNGTTDMAVGAAAEGVAAAESATGVGAAAAVETEQKGASAIEGGGMEFAGAATTKVLQAALSKGMSYTTSLMSASLGVNLQLGESFYSELLNQFNQTPTYIETPESYIPDGVQSDNTDYSSTQYSTDPGFGSDDDHSSLSKGMNPDKDLDE